METSAASDGHERTGVVSCAGAAQGVIPSSWTAVELYLSPRNRRDRLGLHRRFREAAESRDQLRRSQIAWER